VGNDGLDAVLSKVSSIPNLGDKVKITNLDMSDLVETINCGKFYTYDGSLTTPPCSEDVSWFISTTVVPINFKLYNDLKAVVGANARHIQSTRNTENIIKTAAKNLNAKENDMCSATMLRRRSLSAV
jgi:carbonic anhydrase